jgi:hypothetical protein
MKDAPTNPVLPQCATDYIDLVVKKMGYRRKVRADVRQELSDHFTDALHGITDEQQRVEKAMALIKDFGEPKVLATLIRRGKKRCRPIWLKALIRSVQTAGIAIIVFIAYIGWMFTGKPYISVDYVAELNKMVKPTADESLNGEPYYNKAISILTNEPNEVSFITDNSRLPKPWLGDMTPEQIASGRKWVAANTEAILHIRAGNEKPYAWQTYSSRDGSMLGITVLPEGFLHVIELVGWRAWLDGQDGNFDQAFDGVRQCCLLGRHMQHSGIFVNDLISIAIKCNAASLARQIVAQPGVKAESLARFQTDFESLLAQSDFKMSYAGESMLTKDIIQRVFTKSGHVAPLAMVSLMGDTHTTFPSAPSGRPGVGDFGDVILGSYMVLTCPDKAKTLEQAKGFSDKAEQLELITPYKARMIHPTLSEYGNQIMGGNPVLQMMLPNAERVVAKSWLGYANCHALVAQIAVERYKRDKGTYPESLEVLQQTGYLNELPMDPWSDKPLVYRKTADGYTLYSVGMNFTDDGGKSVDKKGKPVLSNSLDGLDIVFWPMPRDGGDKK